MLHAALPQFGMLCTQTKRLTHNAPPPPTLCRTPPCSLRQALAQLINEAMSAARVAAAELEGMMNHRSALLQQARGALAAQLAEVEAEQRQAAEHAALLRGSMEDKR